MKKDSVLLCLSGGIDSSLSAILLKEAGYKVIAVTFRVYDSISNACLEKLKGCCSIESIAEAKYFAEKNNIEHYILDYRDYFKETVIKNFISEYIQGRTPNPCVLCNYEIKWGQIYSFAKELKCDYIATGHYARVNFDGKRYLLLKGKDKLKDQSYFLWKLSQENLSRTIFPLGNYTKEEVKKIAIEKGLNFLAKKKESQEICFIPNNDYRDFLKRNSDVDLNKKGNIITSDGKIVGTHNGISFYTIGQRKGLGIALGKPYYVKEIRPETNEIVVAPYEELKNKYYLVNNINWISIPNINEEIIAEVKVRYRTKPVKSKICKISENKIKVIPLEEVYAVTPGQSAVFYDDDKVLFGGVITQAF
jgi:tRNA-specific 2-thiouridylase